MAVRHMLSRRVAWRGYMPDGQRIFRTIRAPTTSLVRADWSNRA